MSTSPFWQAVKVYGQEPCARSFWEDLSIHLECGYVVSTPTVFVMGRPVDANANHADIVNPNVVFTRPNAWLVYLCAGHLDEALRYLPYPLDYIGFERNNKLRFYPAKRFLKCALILSNKPPAVTRAVAV